MHVVRTQLVLLDHALTSWFCLALNACATVLKSAIFGKEFFAPGISGRSITEENVVGHLFKTR